MIWIGGRRDMACREQPSILEQGLQRAGLYVFGSNTMSNILDRITINPHQCGGRPCLRGMRIRVSDILDLYAAGLTGDEILADMPDLEPDDLKAALVYAARKLDHPVLVA